MSIPIQKRYFLISILIVMTVYLPALYTGMLGMDDHDLLNRLSKISQNPNYWGMFIRNKPTVYYRPLVTLINLVDFKIWGETIGGFHLTNYLFHVLNAVLLYNISLNIFKKYQAPYIFASISMLLFALNPLTCESVAWISGRYDIFGTFFSLLAVSTYFLPNKLRFVLTPLFVLLGFFSKENAFSIVPIIIILDIILNYNGLNPCQSEQNSNNTKTHTIIRSFIIWSFILLIPLIIYIMFRTAGGGGLQNDVARLSTAAAQTTKNFYFNASGYFKIFPAIAFYLKKLAIPFPLNFSISSINYYLYSILFALFALINIYWIIKKRFNYVTIGILLILSFLPSLPIAIGGISWVPFAERYLYLSLCVWGPSLSYLFGYFFTRKNTNLLTLKILLLTILSIYTLGTLNRQGDWTSNEILMFETVKKAAPNNYRVIFNYAVSTNKKERIKYLRQAESLSENCTDSAWRANLYRAIALYYVNYNKPPPINFKKLYSKENGALKKKDSSKSEYVPPTISEDEITTKVFKNIDTGLKLNSSRKALLESVYIILELRTNNDIHQKQIWERAKSYYSKANIIKPDPFLLYRIGGLEKLQNNNEKSATFFRKVISDFPQSQYADFSKTRLRKLREEGLIK